MKINKLITFIFLLQVSALTNAQKLKFESYTTEKGLSVGTVWSILQDSRGYLWFGTANGLNKFDGYKFTVYKHKDNDSTSLSDNNIYELVEDNYGNIWIATALGLNKYDPVKNEFERIDNAVSDQNSNYVIKSLAIDETGEIWIGTEYNGLFSYNPKKEMFTNHNTYIFPTEETGVYVRSLFIDKEQIVWIGTENKGLYSYNNSFKSYKNYRFQKVKNEEWNLLNNNVNEIYEDSKGRLWIGTYRGAINQFNKEKETFLSYGNSDSKIIEQRNRITAFEEDKYGILWVSTYGGLSYFDEKKQDFVKYYTPIQNDNHSINSQRLLSLFCDEAGSLWIGAYDNGVNVVHNTIPKFKHYQKEEGTNKSLSDNIILSFQKVSKDEYYIGTLSGGLNLFNITTEAFVHLKDINPALGNPVLSIHTNNLENIWLATWGSGLINYNKKNNSIISYKKDDKNNSISNNTVLHIHQSSDSILWLGTFNGLNKFNMQTNKFNVYTTANGLQSNVIFFINSNMNDTLWIGTKDGGFSEFNIPDEKFVNYVLNPDDSNSISNNVVLFIHNSNDGNLWLASEKGLNKFNRKTKKFTVYTEDDGLPDNKIYAILQDNNGLLWLSSDKGLCKFNPNLPITNNKAIRTFDINDGLQGNEFTQGGYYKDEATGELFFGGTNGFNVFDPKSITENKHQPEVYITSFKIFDKEVKLDTSILFKKSIELSYKQNFLSFEFVGLDYLNPSKNTFQYKMEGLDINWSVPSNRKYAAYPGMKHGEYIFRVRAANNDGIWNSEGTAFKIIIKPPFWKTTWFIISSIIVGILAVLFYIRVRTYRLEQEKKILEEKVAERTEELRKKNQDITDSITYAKRIQEAILPKVIEFDKAFENNLVLYKPKDIVSGDFFWFTQKEDTRIFAAADCTGHGVPGAFMSIIGNNLLEKIVNEKNIKIPGEILNELNLSIKESLHQEGKKGDTFDGMDIAICTIDIDSDKLLYAGANRPLVWISNKIETSFKGNKYSVGGSQIDQKKEFDTHEINVKSGDKIYIFSDGFPDQFGGPKNRKFMLKQLKRELVNISHLPMLEQEIYLDELIDHWMNGYEEKQNQIDDILIVGVEF